MLVDPRSAGLTCCRTDIFQIIDKVGKENFGLKLKIHFLEESLRKAGPRFHEAALKENTELKVGKITMQKELMGMKKALNQAARDVETYRVHLEDVQEKIKRKHADQGMKAELDGLRKELDVKTVEVSGLRKQLESAESEGHDVAKLKEDIEDLEATLREKDQILETSEDEVDKLKDQAAQNSADMAGLEEELEDARREVEKLQPLMDEFKKLQTSLHSAQVEVQKAKELQSTAEKEKQKAEEDLNELREELADKSFSTKGLSRQLEDKANKLQDDLDSIRRDYAKLQEILDGRTRELKRLTDESHYERQDAEIKQQKLRDDLELLRHEHSTVARKRDSLIDQVQQIKRDLQSKSEEKDLLQSRHDALTTESQALQKDLGRSQMKVQELELNLQEERQHFLRNERTLRDQAKEDFDRLSEEIDCLHRKLEDEANRHSAKEEHWTSQTQQFQMQKERNEQRTAGLQRLVDKLQRIEGTLSSKEMKLQEALESEEQRHQSEDAVLDCQIVELRKDIDDKRRDLEDLRSKHAEIKEELRISQRDCAASEENIVALEDENEVLRVHLDEACTGKIEAITARQELQSQIQSLKQELIRANTARDNAFAELETFIADHRASDGSKEQLDSRLRDMETQLQRVRREKQALQGKLTETDVELGSIRTLAAEAEAEKIETDSLRHDLSAARERETEYLRREAMQKEIIRDLKRQIADLERKIHEAELSRLAADSPKSSVEGSARKTEIVEVRRQLAEAHQQMKDIRSSAKELEREAKRKAAAVAKDTQQRLDECEQQKEQLEHQIADLRLRQEELTVNATTAEQTIKRLRNRIHNLEKDLHAARLNQVEDHTIAEERKDLHEMLKDAKLEAEDLQVQIAGNEKRLQSASIREADLRAQLKCVREERTLQAQKSSALTAELESLQQRYEQSVDEFARSQKDWEEERHAIVSRVRFPNMSVSSVHLGDSTELKQMETELQEKEKRHAAELRGLAKQIQWMRAKCMREERFRFGLAYEKKFLLLQIEMFSAW